MDCEKHFKSLLGSIVVKKVGNLPNFSKERIQDFAKNLLVMAKLIENVFWFVTMGLDDAKARMTQALLLVENQKN